MIKTAVLQKDGAWWFKWCNVGDRDAVMQKDGKPWGVAGSKLAQGLEGPFRIKHEAEITALVPDPSK